MIVREIKVDDAENFINLIKKVETQADFMLMDADERKTTPEQQRKQLLSIKQQSNSIIFVAEEGGNLVGYLIAMGGRVKRTQHAAYIVIGILENFRDKGIGTSLFQSLNQWALNHKISRLELTTVIQNKGGVALYKKSGFEIEGIKRNSLIIDGKSFDEYYMSKLL